MTTARKSTIGVIAIAVIVLLMIFAGRVGGIAIRPTFVDDTFLQITLSSPVLRGTPVVIRWSVGEVTETPILLLFRDSAGEEVLASEDIKDASAQVTFPCESQSNKGSVVMVDKTSQRVLAQKSIELLPAGADCAFAH